MAYQNLKGTTHKTFKIGPNGVRLESRAIKTKGVDIRYLYTNNKDIYGKDLKVAYSSGDEADIYDAFIQSSDILKISYSSGSIRLTLREPLESGETEITLDKFLTGGGVSGPDSSTADAIVLFDDATGQKLKDSQRTISDTITTDDTSVNNNGTNVPSIDAVVNYVGEFSNALKARLEGKI